MRPQLKSFSSTWRRPSNSLDIKLSKWLALWSKAIILRSGRKLSKLSYLTTLFKQSFSFYQAHKEDARSMMKSRSFF